MDRFVQICIAAVLLALGLSWIQPMWPYEQMLHSSLTLVAILALIWLTSRFAFDRVEVGLIALFLVVHCIAARWLYSYVPYDQWFQSLTGTSLQKLFGWERNQFDRLVHFLYGFCFTPALIRILRIRYPISLRHAALLSIMLIMVTSLFYEWFEWIIALLLSPESAEAYNGQQGDVWDAHKDMLLATLGSLLWLPRAVLTRPSGTE